MKKVFILTFLVLVATLGFAQERNVQGTVTSAEDGSPIPGVSISVKGTTTGTITDVNGNYLIKVGDNATLVFSFIGLKTQEVPVQGQSQINVSMQSETMGVDEVVVVGYGTQKKSVVTGSIAKVNSSDINKTANLRTEQALQGRTAGVTITSNSGQPGAGLDVKVRGTSSINSGTQPLYVVDGVPVDGGIDYLNPGDIASIEVLKDAASAAIYGSRGANGVVLITTKNGKAGKMTVSYDGYYGIQNPWKKLSVLDATQYAVIMNEASVNGGGQPIFSDPYSYGKGTDWQDEVFNYDAPIQNHQVTISGGNEKSKYLTSISYFNQQGIVAKGHSNYERMTLRFNADHNVSKIFKFGHNFGYSRSKSEGVDENTEWGSPLGRALNMDPITPVVVTDSTAAAALLSNYPNAVTNAKGQPYGISPYVTSEIVNPVAALAILHHKYYTDKFVGNLYAELTILKNIKLRSTFGADIAFWGNDGSSPVHYLNATNYQDYNSMTRETSKALNFNWENTITYHNLWNDTHDFTFLLGNTIYKAEGNTMGGSKQGMPFYDPSMNYFDYAQNEESENLYGYAWHSSLLSYFGRMNYSYKDKYLFTGTVRMDGSSKFGPNNRYAIFPSFSAGWVLSQEDFMAGSSVVNFLKIRASWGQNGNQQIDDYAYTSLIGSGSRYTFGVDQTLTPGASPTKISNPDLKWETVEQTDIGMDIGLLKNKFRFALDYYHKLTRDMLVTAPIPALVGNAAPLTNLGDMLNTGFDGEFSYKAKIGEVSLDTRLTVSYLKNEVQKIGNESGYITGATWGPEGMQITRIEEGKPMNYFYGYKTNGILQNQAEADAYNSTYGQSAVPGDVRFVDVNNDGTISDLDRTMIGDPTPSWTYGLNVGLNYRQWDFNLFLQGVTGNDIYDASHRYDLANANYTTEVLDRWTGEGTSTTHARVTLNDTNRNYRSSDLYVHSGNYVRIKNLQIGYSLPKGATNWLHISRLRIYGSAQNLYTITGYKGFDPEINGGIDRGIYPQPRTYMMGVNLTF
ncbi:SusC/RagA family TonB-linked outer membrane protein [Prolixibacter denitrificans]|uniref:SusC/RagA family TonB-linked outer membrane protein n=1 Tax=Prolixibacter denitrificans TaxID=1541063 RepID=A0A2P8C9I4_9BACT|nr:TonB-dependent receptor [Prolixibacter denitrificans]PSK81627.1 TonB-linked SusC/RagA family outer membrane protein [Prolixibacter denitrificans]GET21153.1 SusC/RagA family TonB-linked outer membrane protein [Prolixibacter denitrificans]